MKAEDLIFPKTIGQNAEFGFPLFGPYRLMIISINSMNKMARDLEKILGSQKSDVIIARFGYHIGMTTAMAASELYNFDSAEEWLKSGSKFRTFAGIAHEEIDTILLDEKNKSLRFTGSWHGSFELNSRQLTKKNSKSSPICKTLSALASGFASAVLGDEVLVKETQCQSQGYDCCRFEGRSANEWGITTEEIRAHFDLSPFEEEMSYLQKKLTEAQEDLVRKNTEIKRLRALVSRPEFDDAVVFRSKSMEELLVLAQKVAPTSSTVLIEGESGTGKEVVARFVHRHSNRAKEPFVVINCGALPANLLESELFGYVKGAFTGAEKNHTGLIVEAGSGTFFLDEVSELPLDLQVKLLRVLQEKEIRPVGGIKNVRIKARIVAASNRDLRKMVEKGRFREDLFYRLAVFPLHIKPLKDRRSDILPLAHHFLNRFRKDHLGFSKDTIRFMESYSWPGNVRELENCVEYALILAGNKQIHPDHLPMSIKPDIKDPLSDIALDLPTYGELENRYTEMVLKHTGGNKIKAAQILGTSATTLWRRLNSN